VVAKELGNVPEHWFWTHVDELCASYRLGPDAQPLVKQLEAFLKEARAYFKPEVLKGMLERLKTDARVRLSTPELFANVQPDGWANKRLTIKYRWQGKPAVAVLVHCNAPWPEPGKLRLKSLMPSGALQRSELDVPDDFVLRFEVPETTQSGCMMWTVETSQGFVPAKLDKASGDKRKLAFQVSALSTEGAEGV